MSLFKSLAGGALCALALVASAQSVAAQDLDLDKLPEADPVSTEIFEKPMRALVEAAFAGVKDEHRAAMAEHLGCKPEEVTARMTDVGLRMHGPDLKLTKDEADAMRAGRFYDAGNVVRMNERLKVLMELELVLPRFCVVAAERTRRPAASRPPGRRRS